MTVRESAPVPDAQVLRVTKTYPGQEHPAVDDISMRIEAGEFFSILGPSGCGKTTTLRMLAGLERPTSGTIEIQGQDVTDRPAHRRPTNMVFQRLALFPHLTVGENIAFGPRVRRLPSKQIRTRVDELLALVQLGGYEGRLPSQLSGGQQQRVAIARALANEPAVLLLDEPLGSLDLKLRVQMQQALRQIQRDSGTTFVYVTHDQTEAMTMSDRIAVMNAGRIEQIGSPLDMYDRPATRFVASFIGDSNLLEGHHDGTALQMHGWSVRTTAPGAVAMIRPERIRLTTGRTAPNTFPATIASAALLGSSVRLAVALDGVDRSLILEHPRDPSTALPRIGSNVLCELPVQDIVMIPTPAPREDTTDERHVSYQ